METVRITRRQAIQLGAAASLPLVASQSVLAQSVQEKSPLIPPLTVGVSTLGFSDFTNAELAKELAAEGISTVQLFFSQKDSQYWAYNGRSDLSDMTLERCKAIAEAYRSAGITIHSLGVYTNLIHPEASERDANLAYFEAMMKIGQQMGVSTLITEAGHYYPEKTEHDAYDFQEKVWEQMITTGKRLARLAEQYQTTVLMEPYFQSFFASAKRTRLFLEEVDSPRIRALLDPANLLEINDLEEMFAQLGPWVDCIHAKDRKLHTPQGVAAGQGDLDYPKFVKLAAKHTPKAPLILEYVGPHDYKDALKHLKNAIASV